jgi:hypothetical protein
MAEDKKETIVLVTSDEEQYTVEKKVAERSVLIKSMMEGEWACRSCRVVSGTRLGVYWCSRWVYPDGADCSLYLTGSMLHILDGMDTTNIYMSRTYPLD